MQKLASEAERTMVTTPTTHPLNRPENKKLFVFCKGPENNRVGRLVKKYFLDYSFGQK